MTTAADRLIDLADAYWAAWCDAWPTGATAVGERGRDDRLPDPTPAGRAAVAARLADLLAGVDAVDPGALDARTRVTRSALREQLAGDLALLGTGHLDWTVDPLEGVPVELLNIPDFQRLETPADGAAVLARWAAMGPYADATAATLRGALGDGRVACRAPVERTLAILDELLAEPDEAWPLLAPARRAAELPGWSPAQAASFADGLAATVRTGIRPALARFRDLLADEVLPAARPPERPGLCHLPGGEAAYAGLIRVHTTLDTDAAALHALGLAEIERLDGELAALGGRVLGTRTLAEALARLRGDPALHFATGAEVVATARASLARAEAAVPAWFGRLPATPCEVVEIGAHEAAHSTIAYYRAPAADGSRPGQYYVNASAPTTRPRYEAEVLAFHESVPGHHTQLALAQEVPGLPAFRRHLGPTAFAEGWGLYVERLADEMGLYTGDLDRIGVLSFDAWRASRLVVDTGLHALGWTRDRAIAFMTEHTALAPNNIANEVDRYIVWPGQALAYKTGQLELLAIRADARARLGDRFRIAAFHDAVLEGGALALATVRGRLDAWVAEQLGEA